MTMGGWLVSGGWYVVGTGFADQKEVKDYLKSMARLRGVQVSFREEAQVELALDDSEREVLAQLLLQDNVHPLRYVAKALVVHCDQAVFALQTKEGQVREREEGLCVALNDGA